MAILQLKRGPTANIAAQTLAAGELGLDTTLNQLVVGDGSTAGGGALKVASAPLLSTARTFRVNLASTTAVSFDGSANITPGVTGTLPITNGGTGNTTGLAASATKLATARGIQVNLASSSAPTFDGTAAITPGVTGILPVANGGTGGSTAAAALSALGAAANGANADITQLTGLTGASPLPGVTDASTAAAGKIGQMVEANASAVAITSGTQTNITSISLPAGEWDVYGEVQEVFSATGSASSIAAAIATASATDPGFPYKTQLNVTITGTVAQFQTPRRFLQLSATTTVYLVAAAVFGSGTCAAAGYIHARRIR